MTFLFQGENATLQYILVGANDKFDVRSSGQIVVKANIDREEQSQYKFVVCCCWYKGIYRQTRDLSLGRKFFVEILFV
jgi:hypothetical protein